MTRAVFLDRDGVINATKVEHGKPYPPKNLEEFVVLPKVSEALHALKSAGFLLFVITNQPDVARGKTKLSVAEEINKFIIESFPISEIYTCYHDDEDACDCRKPKPGNIIKAANLYEVDIQRSFMVGDRWRDVDAGESAGCKTIFIDYGYEEKRPVNYDYKASSLYEAAIIILEKCI